jgi:uncharacterized protein YdeI (YjbR/CyaY-like superfamily)
MSTPANDVPVRTQAPASMKPSTRPSRAEYPNVEARDRAAWRAWLRHHHVTSPGVWLVYYKKGSGVPSVIYAEAVEEALCFGWIDSKIHAVDSLRYRQIFTPRKPGSMWSKLNKRRVATLIRSKRMTPAGMAKITAARKDGSWKSLDEVENLRMPAELTRALAVDTPARGNFEGFSDSGRKLIIRWITSAKRPETRLRRIQKTVRLASLNKKPY